MSTKFKNFLFVSIIIVLSILVAFQYMRAERQQLLAEKAAMEAMRNQQMAERQMENSQKARLEAQQKADSLRIELAKCREQ